jgi:hypothetical protein
LAPSQISDGKGRGFVRQRIASTKQNHDHYPRWSLPLCARHIEWLKSQESIMQIETILGFKILLDVHGEPGCDRCTNQHKHSQVESDLHKH